ncbi:lipopolysaccharide biosynthesis protein [Halobacterium litoreum]|uniref:Lipopolysaccharide biosynthesis protein n=1 Tax=Halobacterium litoreum TaxID=2039234 RepID=A0ABD5NAY8_9EURY|nr:oligosaccharide flippase family protein [Halobacterium litoreum]UHH14733.1 oligosaccharide flippase family protein [Halobacterium litoreum]
MKTPAEVDLTREALFTFLWDSLDKIAAFVAFVYFANYFSTSSFGTAYTLIGISLILGSAPNAIAIAIRKRISEDTSDYERFFTFGAIFIVGYAALCGAAVFWLGSVTELPFEPLAVAGIAHLLGRTFLFHVERIFDGVGSTGTAAGLDFADGLLTAVLRFLFILGFGMGAAGLIYSAALSGLLVGLTAYLRRFEIPTQPPRWSTFDDVRNFSGWSLLSRLGNEILENSVVVLPGLLFSPTLASYIKSAKNLIEPARIPVRSVIESIFVQVSASIERGNNPVQAIQNGVDVAILFATPLTAGALVLGDEVMVTVYGAQYADSGYILAAVAAAFVFQALTKILTSSLAGSNYPDLVAKSSILTTAVAVPLFAVTLTLDWESLFLYCLVGSHALRSVISLYYLNTSVASVTDLSWRFIGHQLVASTVMAVMVWVLLRETAISSWMSLLFIVGAGAASYGLVLLTISKEGRRIANTVLKRLNVP